MLDRFPVFGLQVANHIADARADPLFEFRFVACGSFSPEQLVSFRAGGPSAVMVDDGVSQDAVEPCHNALLVTELGTMLQGFHVGRLKDIFRCGGFTDASRDEAKELRVMCSNPPQNRTLSRIMLMNGARSNLN